MLTLKRNVQIEWGDCDPAGIVFFPRYFAIFDTCTILLIEHALGMKKIQWQKHYDVIGCPLVDIRARFLGPNRYGDDTVVETTVAEIKRSSFNIDHKMYRNGELTVEGFETRVWTGRDPANPERIRSKPLPPVLIERFQGTGS